MCSILKVKNKSHAHYWRENTANEIEKQGDVWRLLRLMHCEIIMGYVRLEIKNILCAIELFIII